MAHSRLTTADQKAISFMIDHFASDFLICSGFKIKDVRGFPLGQSMVFE